jgi:hypothetical protein
VFAHRIDACPHVCMLLNIIAPFLTILCRITRVLAERRRGWARPTESSAHPQLTHLVAKHMRPISSHSFLKVALTSSPLQR